MKIGKALKAHNSHQVTVTTLTIVCAMGSFFFASLLHPAVGLAAGIFIYFFIMSLTKNHKRNHPEPFACKECGEGAVFKTEEGYTCSECNAKSLAP